MPYDDSLDPSTARRMPSSPQASSTLYVDSALTRNTSALGVICGRGMAAMWINPTYGRRFPVAWGENASIT
jgi:hypothetical protein